MGLTRRRFQALLSFACRPPSRFTVLWVWASVICFVIAGAVPDCFLVARAFGFLIFATVLLGIILFALHRNQLEDLEKRVPSLPVNYYPFGDAKIGPYTPSVGRYPEYLQIIPFETYYPANWLPWISRVHRVEFICLDDPTHDYNHDAKFQLGYSDLWHLRDNWYVTLP
jgi:hypothetical protein